MTPLQTLESFDPLIAGLFSSVPQPDPALHLQAARQRYFTDLSNHWVAKDNTGKSRRERLASLRHAQLLAEMTLRIQDQTLSPEHASLLQRCLDHPLPWQRQQLPRSRRPQLYRPLLDITTPHWRNHLPGVLVIVEGAREGQMLDHTQATGLALLCSPSHGIEAFANLMELHVELSERLDDTLQSQSMLQLFSRDSDQDHARNAERLRYDWFSDDMTQTQAQCLVDAQQARLTKVWRSAQAAQTPLNDTDFIQALANAADLSTQASSKPALQTRYALKLERHSPAWIRNASAQAKTHIMQTMQELVIAVDQAAAPGIPTHEQFLQRNTLLDWTRERLRDALRHRHQFDGDPAHIQISVTLARQTGPILHPGLATGYIPVASRPQVGDTIELVKKTYSLDQLALLNIGWFDVDYWLTARVHHSDGRSLPELKPGQLKQLVRDLNVGSGYIRFLQTHLIDSNTAQWRRQAYANINRARMRTELAKARYAGHLADDPLEQGYRWAKAVLSYPDSRWRPTVEEHRLSVRQLLITGHTLQGVLLIVPETPQLRRFLVYAPDAPDRRPWREYANTRELLRSLRTNETLRNYVLERLPLANRKRVEKLLEKGRWGSRQSRPEIFGDFQHASYQAQVRAMMAAVDAGTVTKKELLGETSLNALWIVLDLMSLVLPNRALIPLSFGRAALCALDGLDALEKGDRIGILKHLVDALTHANDGINSIAGSTVMRRAIRGMPPPPPLKLPPSHQANPQVSRLRYRLDGIHDEGVYEEASPYPGLSNYYIQDNNGRYYQVAHDGQRWRVFDPRQPDAYTKVPVKKRQDGSWVVDSPVLWYDGLPDLTRLLEQCHRPVVASNEAGADGLHQHDGQRYLSVGRYSLPIRAHLLEDHYHLMIPGPPKTTGAAWAILRLQQGEWHIRVRQAGRNSDWLALPQTHSVSRGST
ncbi:dermonecrotic toxin domain-containing protein [Pseudomonas putida]|uniref:dermonecrotic toxin domain-containing protein n=1 Tax=Pseudomonas putida TaxID=303 RepID=UPI00383BF62F